MIFLGASQSKIGIDPMKMFIDTGITGYSLATDAQPLYVSSLLLQEAFEKQIPKLVVLDIGTCFHKDEFFQDKSYRFVSDNMKNDKSKEQLSLYFASRFPYRKRIENYLSMKFPLINIMIDGRLLLNRIFNYSTIVTIIIKGIILRVILLQRGSKKIP